MENVALLHRIPKFDLPQVIISVSSQLGNNRETVKTRAAYGRVNEVRGFSKSDFAPPERREVPSRGDRALPRSRDWSETVTGQRRRSLMGASYPQGDARGCFANRREDEGGALTRTKRREASGCDGVALSQPQMVCRSSYLGPNAKRAYSRNRGRNVTR